MADSRKKKLLVLIPYLTPSVGGGAFVFFRQLEFLAQRYDLRTVCFSERARQFIPREVPSYLIPKDVGRLVYYVQYPGALFRLASIMASFRPDVVLANSYQPYFLAILARLLTFSSCRLITGEHNNLATMFDRVRFGKLRSFLITRLDKYADLVVTPSAGMRDSVMELCRLPPAKVKSIRNPVLFEGMRQLAEEPLDSGLLSASRFILTVGALGPQKNHELLLRAFAMVKKAADLKCVVAGGGPPDELGKLKRLSEGLGIEKDVIVLGHTENPYKYMSKAAAFVLSSDYEGFGNVIIEAMACGCPVVSTDCSFGPREIIIHEHNGLLSAVGDAPALAKNILQVTGDHGFAARLKRNAMATVRLYSSEAVAEDYSKAIDACLGVNRTA
jgi:glycosyltransferase involved in cell wall biosynthesis